MVLLLLTFTDLRFLETVLPQVSFPAGSRALNHLRKAIEDGRFFEDRPFCIKDGIHAQDISFKPHATRFMHSLVVEIPDKSGSADSSIFSPYPNEFDDIVRGFANEVTENQHENLICSVGEGNGSYPLIGDLKYMESADTYRPQLQNGELASEITGEASSGNVYSNPMTSQDIGLPSNASPIGAEFQNLPDSASQSLDTLSKFTSSGSSLFNDEVMSTIRESPMAITDTLNSTNKGSLNLKGSMDNFLSGATESVDMSINRGLDAVKSSYDSVVSSVTDAVKSVTESFDNAVSSLTSSAGNSREQASHEFTGFLVKLQENVSKTGSLATDILRRAIVTVEDSLSNVSTFAVDSYGSAKSLLPPDFKNAVSLSEGKATEILSPVGAAAQQVSR